MSILIGLLLTIRNHKPGTEFHDYLRGQLSNKFLETFTEEQIAAKCEVLGIHPTELLKEIQRLTEQIYACDIDLLLEFCHLNAIPRSSNKKEELVSAILKTNLENFLKTKWIVPIDPYDFS